MSGQPWPPVREQPQIPLFSDARPDAVSVGALNALARELLEREFRPLWVVGEIANWRRVDSGHCYFTLRDEAAQVSCLMWRSDARALPTEPAEGMEVYALGSVTLYEKRGQFQLLVRSLEGKGEGLWRLAFERLRGKLAAEGLLDRARKRPLPTLPRRVGVVTSRTGAAVRDLLSVIRRRAPWTDILVAPCRVQGEGAALEVARALEAVPHFGVDVVVVARGGGSVEDLWAFNEEGLARAVARCPVPVVSAVGHEIDVTIVDLVADARAPTPSAAGELVVPDVRALRSRVRGLAGRLGEGLRGWIRRGEQRAEWGRERLDAAVGRCMDGRTRRTERLGTALDALSPLATLRRGYAVPLGVDGRVLRGVADFEPGLPFDLRVTDGRVACQAGGTDAG